MRFSVRALLGAALAFLLLGSGLAAQEPVPLGGSVWRDANFDGVRQPDEPPLAGVAVTLLSSGERVFSDADGRYSFEAVAPGQHQVSLSGDSGLVAAITYPALVLDRDAALGVNVGDAGAVLDFGVVSASDTMVVVGEAWVDAVPVEDASIRALIGGVDCTIDYRSLQPPHQALNFYQLAVAPEGLIEGCGRPGATIEFEINGRLAHETAHWQVAATHTRLTLTAGPPFAVYYGERFPELLDADGNFEVVAYINGNACSDFWLVQSFVLVVYSNEQVPGCAVQDSPIEFRVNGVRSGLSSVRWSPGIHDDQSLDLRPLVGNEGPPPVGECLVDCGERPAATPTSGPVDGGITPPAAGDAGLLAR